MFRLTVAKNGPKLKPADPKRALSKDFSALLYKGGMELRQYGIGSLAESLARIVGSPVIDDTGLTGQYDISLQWTPDEVPSSDLKADSPPSIFVAVQQDLGLKLEAAKMPLEFLVIDHIERPSEN